MGNRTATQTLLLIVGAVVLLGGLVCLVAGFADFAGAAADPVAGGDVGSAMALFMAGGFAMVIGFGIIAFTRAAILTRNGSYARIVVEQGIPPRGGRFCSGCGAPVAPSARFCESCGAAVG